MVIKKLIITAFLIICLTASYVYPVDIIEGQSEVIKERMVLNKELANEAQKSVYNNFLSCVNSKISFKDVNCGWAYFNPQNENLIIGNSGTVWCGFTLNDEGLSRFSYDLIGYGGVFDDEYISWLKSLGDKKYRNIVIFGGVNDVNIRALSNYENVDLLYCNILIDVLSEAKKHILSGGKIVYVKVKPMEVGVDNPDAKFVKRFNKMASQINDNIESFGYLSYEIPFDTSDKYSSHYIHYNNSIVFETMFDNIKNM